MDKQTKQAIIDNYYKLYLKHGSGPEVAQWSHEGQRFRFDKLLEIGDLKGATILDLGCNLGDLYPLLRSRLGEVIYTGVDIVPEIVVTAARSHPDARFLCLDVLNERFDETFDYILISGMFNNAMPAGTEFLKRMVSRAYQCCIKGVGFNFTSSRVNFRDAEMQYHDPLEIFRFCLDELTPKISFHHHYERCDVAVFAYR